jgi:hypothetical protein
MGLLHECAGRLTAKNGGFRPGQVASIARCLDGHWQLHLKASVVLWVHVTVVAHVDTATEAEEIPADRTYSNKSQRTELCTYGRMPAVKCTWHTAEAASTPGCAKPTRRAPLPQRQHARHTARLIAEAARAITGQPKCRSRSALEADT